MVVRVADGRSSPVLGTRGGLYADTSNITVQGQDILPRLQTEAEAAVRLLGFTPSPNAFNAPQLTLTLADLKYQSPKEGVYVTKADISATFRVDVQNASRRYSGRYSASLAQQFGTAPNQETNTKLVSGVLSDALTRAFRTRPSGRCWRSEALPAVKEPGPRAGLFLPARFVGNAAGRRGARVDSPPNPDGPLPRGRISTSQAAPARS